MSNLIIFAGQTFSNEEIARYNKKVAASDRLVIINNLPFFQHEIDEHKAELEKDVRTGFMSKELAAFHLNNGPRIARFPRPDWLTDTAASPTVKEVRVPN
jgi:hypothetical protein